MVKISQILQISVKHCLISVKHWFIFDEGIVPRSVFEELQLMQILNFRTSSCNLKIRGLGARKKKNLYGPFLWMGFNCLKAKGTLRRQFTFYHWVPRKSWYSFYQPRKNERLSQPWSHPVDLNTGPLNWKSRALTSRPLLAVISYIFFIDDNWQFKN